MHRTIKNRRGCLKTRAKIVEHSQGAAVSRVSDKIHHRRVSPADQIIDGPMRPQIFLTRPLVSQLVRNELFDVSESTFTPVRPGYAQLFAGLRKSLPAAPQELRPIEDSAGHAAGFGLGVQDVAQPEQTPVSGTEAVTPLERPADFERRPYGQKRSGRPFGLVEHPTPEWHESAHARVLQDRQSDIAEFVREGRLCARVQGVGLQRLDLVEVESAPILPIASTGSENGVVEVHNDARFPIPSLIVGGRRNQMPRGRGAKTNERSGGARRSAAMHAQHNHDGRVE